MSSSRRFGKALCFWRRPVSSAQLEVRLFKAPPKKYFFLPPEKFPSWVYWISKCSGISLFKDVLPTTAVVHCVSKCEGCYVWCSSWKQGRDCVSESTAVEFCWKGCPKTWKTQDLQEIRAAISRPIVILHSTAMDRWTSGELKLFTSSKFPLRFE